jgi:hypothetical protein
LGCFVSLIAVSSIVVVGCLGQVVLELSAIGSVLALDAEFELALLRAKHDRLALHAPDHVEGRLGLAAQGHLQQVLLDARLDRLAQLALDLEVAVRGAEPPDALVRPPVVVVFDPESDPLPRRLEALELRAREEFLPDALPEALDLAQGHGMLRP